MYTIVPSANQDTLTSSFPTCIPLVSFGCLIALAISSSTILNRYRESQQPCFVPDFNGIALSFFPFELMLAVGLF